MSEPLGDDLRQTPASPPSSGPPADVNDDDAVNLLDGSAEPTDDSPTVISKTPQSQVNVRAEDNGGGVRGRRLAHFELIEPIGVGGMAAVLRARDTQLDRLVALKILPPEMAADAENVRRFHQEARSAARLDHENIARVFFCGEDQRLHFIAFEFVEGENLRTILEKRGRLPVAEALHYMLQAAAGLAHAARRGVVHRDIKPSNIIITPNGRAKLVDMGLARSLEPQHDQGLTQSGVTLGTFDYISPEQALEPRDADVRSDIYSLGCTFYHLLTGQPPVPEGTAAKKLHHHQHVKPPDPRQFVHDLPDEAAVILDRMMAKQPKDRYQTPEHLVHHLYLAARKLGIAGEVPEGALAVEAALPTPPASRPLLLAALAVLAVIGLIFLVDSSSTPKTQPSPNPPPLLSATSSAQESPTPPQPDPVTPLVSVEDPPPTKAPEQAKAPPRFSKENPTAADLAKFLKENKDAPAIILEWDDLDLQEFESDLVIANPTVTIQPRTPGQRPTIRDHYRALARQDFQASLTIKSEICIIEKIRFVLNQTGARMPMAMLRLLNTRQATIRDCEFLQVSPGFYKDKRMTSVLAESDRPAVLTVTESCFLGFRSLSTERSGDRQDMIFDGADCGGQDAISRSGPVRIDASNCLFGPHSAVFRLDGSAPNENGRLQLTHCSVLAGNTSAVYDLADNADAQIDARFSLFSRPGEASMIDMMDSNGAVLLRCPEYHRGQVAYQGDDNRYHQLDDLPDSDAEMEAEQHRRDDIERNIADYEKLETSPWNDPQPLDRLKDQVPEAAIQAAFAVKRHLPQLRVRSQQSASGQLIGAERVLTFSYLDKLPRLNEGPVAPSQPELVVQSRTGLAHALIDAGPGDIIRLQVDGEIELEPHLLSGEKCKDLTIRADPGFRPVLTMKGEEAVNVPALFAIFNGKLQLEGLEIRLRPRRDKDGSALVSFFGDGECVLKNCLVTLERSEGKTALAVLPDKRMRNTASSMRTPRLQIEGCFLRGQGDLLAMPRGHALEVTIKNSLLALSGSLLDMASDPKDGKDDWLPPTTPLTLRLHKVTTYLGEHLIRLHAAKDIKELVKTRCRPGDCLFLPARSRPLVRLEGPEGDEKDLREKLSWESTGKNAYGSFTALLEQQSVGIMEKMPTLANQETWKNDVSREFSSAYNVKLPAPPAADAAFTQLLPRMFRPAEDFKDCGADLAALQSLPALKDTRDALDFDSDFFEFGPEPDSDR